MNKPSEPLSDFVAIDVEYANSDQEICQFGLAVVSKLQIVNKFSWLIRPLSDYYEEPFMNHNHITPEDTMHTGTFDLVWQEIQPYILMGQQIWAHNARSVEQPVLKKNLEMHFFDASWLNILDSEDLYQRPDCPPNKGNGLQQCCMALGIPFDEEKHHDAEYDAIKCAEIVIAYANGQKPNWTGIPKSKEELRKQQLNKRTLHLGEFDDYYANNSSDKENVTAVLSSTYPNAPEQKLEIWGKGDNIKKDGTDSIDFSRLNKDNYHLLQGKNIVLSGIFRYKRMSIENAIYSLGAKKVNDNTPSRNTDVIILGTRSVGPKKLTGIEKQERKGHHIARIVGDADLEELLYGNGNKFFMN